MTTDHNFVAFLIAARRLKATKKALAYIPDLIKIPKLRTRTEKNLDDWKAYQNSRR